MHAESSRWYCFCKWFYVWFNAVPIPIVSDDSSTASYCGRYRRRIETIYMQTLRISFIQRIASKVTAKAAPAPTHRQCHPRRYENSILRFLSSLGRFCDIFCAYAFIMFDVINAALIHITHLSHATQTHSVLSSKHISD